MPNGFSGEICPTDFLGKLPNGISRELPNGISRELPNGLSREKVAAFCDDRDPREKQLVLYLH